LCSIARNTGHPIILVQVGYRLGALGFAASEDLLAAEARRGATNGSDGSHSSDLISSVGNYGFVDQINALKWVREHIEDFGGDPQNVTAFGISAGSASVHYHILTGNPMFDRAICMSGSAPTLGPLPFERYQKAWNDLCRRTGIEGETPEARVKFLTNMEPLQVLRSYSSASIGPMGDDIILPKSWTFEQRNSTRCQSLIIGDTNVEGVILDGLAKKLKPSKFQELVQSVLSSADQDTFNGVFGFSGDDDQPWETYRDSMRRFLSVMMFQLPNLRIAETFQTAGGGEAYLYHFEELSPYPGPTFGMSYHGQCALYMYCVENDALPEEAREVAETMARMWTAFAHGERPWEPYTRGERYMRFGPGGHVGLTQRDNDDTRQYQRVDWLKEQFEPLKRLTQSLLGGE